MNIRKSKRIIERKLANPVSSDDIFEADALLAKATQRGKLSAKDSNRFNRKMNLAVLNLAIRSA